LNITKNIKIIARNVLLNESEAVKKCAERIDDNFERVVTEILRLEGRVVLTGIGKSAIIANKIVATLNSTGTPAIFMHAADAIHGDLGMIQKNDLVICLSKSGNTPEIKVLVPLIKRRGVKLVALVSDLNSYLGENADMVIDGTIEREACTNNLAPTTSTTVHLALGDALAVALQEARGFGSDDFAVYHPGGALGKKLYLKVDDLIEINQKPVVGKNESIRKVIVEISSKRIGAVAVVEDDEKLIGIVTDGDLRRMMEKHDSFESLTAQDIMSHHPKTIPLGSFAVEALKMMQDNNITQVIVTEKERIHGFVHLHDLLKEGIV